MERFFFYCFFVVVEIWVGGLLYGLGLVRLCDVSGFFFGCRVKVEFS